MPHSAMVYYTAIPSGNSGSLLFRGRVYVNDGDTERTLFLSEERIGSENALDAAFAYILEKDLRSALANSCPYRW